MLNDRSRRALVGVHPDLVRVVEAAAARMPLNGNLAFIVTEGVRSKKRQAELVASGASWTMDGRHLTGHAVDIAATVNGSVRWDWALYPQLAAVFKAEAARLGITLTWGGDWRRRRDGPHFELPRAQYPAS
jgi:peptidoglycan L-alanyl-D-glutamate endopeptidase CwlK